MRVIVIMHVESEGPGTLGQFLESIGARVRTVRLYAGDRLPARIEEWQAVVSMGGPMNVDQEEEYPFLREEIEFLQRAIPARIPILGICLGAQMIAKACGARVSKAPVGELGWGQVALTPEGQADPLFRDLPPILPVFQWHEDTFEIPPGGTLLASSRECPHQAFRYHNAYGLQFHLEVTRDMLWEWFEDSPKEEREDIIRRFEELKHDLLKYANKVYSNFVSLAQP